MASVTKIGKGGHFLNEIVRYGNRVNSLKSEIVNLSVHYGDLLKI